MVQEPPPDGRGNEPPSSAGSTPTGSAAGQGNRTDRAGMAFGRPANQPGMPLAAASGGDWDHEAALDALIAAIEAGRVEIPPEDPESIEDPDGAAAWDEPASRCWPGDSGAPFGADSGAPFGADARLPPSPSTRSVPTPSAHDAVEPVPECMDAGFLPHGPNAAGTMPPPAEDQAVWGPQAATGAPQTGPRVPRGSSETPRASSGPPDTSEGLPDTSSGLPDSSSETPRSGSGTPGTGPGAQQAELAGKFAAGGELDTARPGPELARLADAAAGDDRSYAGVNDDQLIGLLAAWQRTEAWAASAKLSAIAELIRRRPPDRSPVEPGDVPAVWGEFCGDELAVAMTTSGRAAEQALALAYDLAARVHGTSRALREGMIDSYKARIISEATRVLDAPGAAAAEALVLPRVASMTPGQLRAAIGRAVLRVDPEAARNRRKQAEQDARIELWREDAGTAALCGFGLPPDEALAADQLINSRAKQLKAAGLAGTMDQLRARAYLDFLLGKDSACHAGDMASDGPAGPDDALHDDGTDAPATAASGTARAGGTAASGAGAGEARAGEAPPGAGAGAARAGAALAARINLTIPLATLLGLAERPGDAAGFGAVDADLARSMATSAARNPATSWCVTVVDERGHSVGHGCARRGHDGRTGRAGRAGPDRHGDDGSTAPGPAGGGFAATGATSGTRMTRTAGTNPATDAAAAIPAGSASRASPAFTMRGGPGPPGGYGTWRLSTGSGGRELVVEIGSVPVDDCDHRDETSSYRPSGMLRHLVGIRDAECTWPPCRRNARRCDFEHTIPWQQGGRTCACNGGPRCRHHHRQKQAPGWRVDQYLPGYQTWTTPSGRQYTSEPHSYPV